ncbi:MAG: hypothetical protein DRP74_08160 [Candidatus Omnitrophota bacterium]|nr:MAG: hypothetical protein DRP74_08160 [Candidatus Omnitrophota bacterium]
MAILILKSTLVNFIFLNYTTSSSNINKEKWGQIYFPFFLAYLAKIVLTPEPSYVLIISAPWAASCPPPLFPPLISTPGVEIGLKDLKTY